MSSVVSSSQFGTYTSSHDGSSVSDGGAREDFRPTPENLETFQMRIENFKRENELICQFARLKGKDLFPQGTSIDNMTRGHERRKFNPNKQPKLPVYKKLEMANFVLESIDAEMKAREQDSARKIATIKAKIIQVAYREKELQQEIAHFQSEIIEKGRDDRTGLVCGEKLLKWYDDSVKQKDINVGKLKLKTDSLRSQTKRIWSRLQQKIDLGEKHQQVDYDQLQINNEAFQSEITKLSKDLADYQQVSSTVVAKLSQERANLAEEEKQCRNMQQSIDQKQKAIDKYAKETQSVEDDHAKLKSSNDDITTKKSEYRVPDVADYITKKANIYELSKVIKNWERKVQLAEMNVKRLKKDLDELDSPR